MCLVTCVNNMTISTIMGTDFSVTVKSKILVILIGKTNFSKRNIFFLSNFSTKRTGHTCQLALLLSNKGENFGYRWNGFHKEHM